MHNLINPNKGSG